MGVLVVGTVTLDTVETPTKRVADVLGGSGVYAAVAASFLATPFDLLESSGLIFHALTQIFLIPEALTFKG